ncbi:MAG: hypothetical protein VKJ46_07145 [Leptolyngbyaceae bacterium]|nr:hypothetical protein [Leptolyngbyaceae bacterium]
MNSFDLEQAISKLTMAMISRNSEIGKDLITFFRKQLTLQELAGLMLISLERLLRFDAEALLWAIDTVVPSEVLTEIRKMTSVALYQRLIHKGFMPGKDLSVDLDGTLLLTQQARKAALC